MSEFGPSDIRVSDPEREDALRMLGEHMTSGRLDVDEYGERTAKVAAAKTRGQVLELFADLPDPRPTFGQPSPAVPAPIPVPGPPPARRQQWVAERLAPVLVPLAGVLALVLFLTVFKFWFIFLLPMVIAGLTGWNGDQHRRHRGHRRPRDQY